MIANVRGGIRRVIVASLAALATLAMSSVADAALAAEPTHPASPLYAVVLVDITPDDAGKALPYLQAYVKAAEKDPAVLSIALLRRIGTTNHFTLQETFRSAAAYDKFVGEPYVRQMRVDLQPMLASPFDERFSERLSTP